jgi:hypothetical protein
LILRDRIKLGALGKTAKVTRQLMGLDAKIPKKYFRDPLFPERAQQFKISFRIANSNRVAE